MDAETLAALQGSIAKWKAIVAGTGRDEGMWNCPLCLRFALEKTAEPEHVGKYPLNTACAPFPFPILHNGDWYKSKIVPCKGCPIEEKTEWSHCQDTPYAAYVDEFDPQRMQQIASEELEFLKSLLPA